MDVRINNGNELDIASFSSRRYLTSRDVYQDFIDFVVENTSSEIGYFHLYDEVQENISLNVWSRGVYAGCTTSVINHSPLATAGIWADAIRDRCTVVHNDYEQCASRMGLPDGHFEVTRHMSTPILWQDEVVAILGVGNATAPYTQKDVRQLEYLAKIGWPIIQDRLHEFAQRIEANKRVLRHKSAEELMLSMVGTVAKALELKDEYTSYHQFNVSEIAGAISTEMGLPEDQIYGIRLGATVHDIGKIAVPAEILSKPGTLNEAEIAMVKMHTTLGAEIFRDVDLPWPVLDIIEQHHERMDGSGYPKGLVGNAICLEARIVAVADTYDAMASDRPYRHAPGLDAALEALKKGRGTKYDAYVVDAFFSASENGGLNVEKLYGY